MARGDWGFSGKKIKGPPWPKKEDGKPIPPAYLKHLRATDFEGEIVVNLLASADIPVMTQLPNDGAFGQIILGFSGTGVDLYVPETLLEEAKALLDSQFEEIEFDDVQD